MKAAVLRSFGEPLIVEDVDVSPPQPEEVRIRVTASGVCHSDRTAQLGGQRPPLPTVLGHEVAGVVIEAGGDVRDVRVGETVAVCSVTDCGKCPWCLIGNPQHCINRHRTRPDKSARIQRAGEEIFPYVGLGGFAEEILVHESTVTRISDKMPPDRACLLGCAVVTGVGAVTRSANVSENQTMAVIGCGGVGLNAIQAGRLRKASRIIAIDVSSEKLALAVVFGATDVVNASETDPVDAVLQLTGGVDHTFEAVGRPQTISQAFAMLGPLGTATCIGVTRIGDEIVIPAGELMLEKRLQGSKMGRTVFRRDAPALVELYLSGDLLLDELVSTTRPLDTVNQALDELDAGGLARSVVTF